MHNRFLGGHIKVTTQSDLRALNQRFTRSAPVLQCALLTWSIFAADSGCKTGFSVMWGDHELRMGGEVGIGMKDCIGCADIHAAVK